MPQGYELKVNRGSPRTTIVFSGELDLYSSPRLLEAVHLVFDKLPPEELRLDLRRVELLASAGIGALLRIAAICRDSGVSLHLDLSTKARQVLDLVGLWWLGVVQDGLAIDEALETARKAYAESRFELD